RDGRDEGVEAVDGVLVVGHEEPVRARAADRCDPDAGLNGESLREIPRDRAHAGRADITDRRSLLVLDATPTEHGDPRRPARGDAPREPVLDLVNEGGAAGREVLGPV